MKKGSVALVGAGCGDPEFLTCKAKRLLQECEVLVYDDLVADEIVKQAPADCEKIYVGKRYGRHAMKQEEINALLAEKANEKKRVVRLKGGDPYVFGRGGEEFLALSAAGISCSVVPGITSAIAVPAAAGIPVTHRGVSRSFTVITGTAAQKDGTESLEMDFETLARLEGTLVILMGVHHLEEIAAGLLAAGKAPETPCAIVMEGTTDRQRCVRGPLAEIALRAEKAKTEPPAVIVIGAAAQMELSCVPDGPGAYPADRAAPGRLLSGLRIGAVGTPHFVKKVSAALKEQGAQVILMDFMEVIPSKAALPDLSAYGWLVFTSPNGAQIFLQKMRKEHRDMRSLSQNKIAVIGPGTAEVLQEAGLYADYMPDIYDAVHLAEGVTERIREEETAAQRSLKPALFLRAASGSRALPGTFAKKKLAFYEFPLYEMGIEEKKREKALQEKPDYVVFGAASGVRAWFEEPLPNAPVPAGRDGRDGRKVPGYVCMGEACGRQLRELGVENFLTARESSIAGITECLCREEKTRRETELCREAKGCRAAERVQTAAGETGPQ